MHAEECFQREDRKEMANETKQIGYATIESDFVILLRYMSFLESENY